MDNFKRNKTSNNIISHEQNYVNDFVMKKMFLKVNYYRVITEKERT